MAGMLGTIVTVVHLSACFLLIGIVLLQQGKGADAGATFGGGGGNTFFGAGGADNFLTRTTTFIAIAFMCTSFLLARGVETASMGTEGTLMEKIPQAETNVAPVEANRDGVRPLIPLSKEVESIPSEQTQPAAQAEPAKADIPLEAPPTEASVEVNNENAPTPVEAPAQ